MPAGSIYDSDRGNTPTRYSMNGQRHEPDPRDEEILAPMSRMVQNVVAEGDTALAEISKRMNNRLSTFGANLPAETPLDVRKFLFWKNSDDQARVSAFKANRDRALMLADMFLTYVKLGDHGHALATQADLQMWVRNQQLPPELQGFGEVIRQFTDNALAAVLSEMMTMHPDMSMKAIARTTKGY